MSKTGKRVAFVCLGLVLAVAMVPYHLAKSLCVGWRHFRQEIVYDTRQTCRILVEAWREAA